MAYSAIEQRYINLLTTAEFPDAIDEPVEQEPSLDGVQLAAGPSATRTDAPQSYGEIRAVQPTKMESALQSAGVTLEQIGRFVDGLGQVDVPGMGPISLADLLPFVGSAKNRSVMGTDWQGTPMALQAPAEGRPLVTGKGQTLQLSDDAKLAAFDVLPAAQGIKTAAKGAKKGVQELAPVAGQMAEDYLRRTGGLMDVAPPRVDSIDRFPIGPGSIKPRVIAQDKPLHREMSAENLMDFLRSDKQFSYAPVFVTDNADLAIGQGSNAGVKVKFRANSVSGEKHSKPMTGDIAGREYQADVFAPMAIESITFASEADLKKVKSVAARVLQTDFERVTDGKKNVVFVRKAQGEEKN